MGPPRKLPSGTNELNRSGSFLGTFFFELLVYTCKKSGKAGRRPAQLSKDFWDKMEFKKEVHRQWNKGHVSWEAYRKLPGCVGMGLGKLRHIWR